jgi:hypothetical protein
LVRVPDFRLPTADWVAEAGKPDSALMGEMEMMRSSRDVAPAKTTL